MPCIPLPPLPIPDLPDGINLSVKIPIPKITTPGVCCLPPIPILAVPAISLGPGAINPAIVQTVKQALAGVKIWYANLPPKCPKLGLNSV